MKVWFHSVLEYEANEEGVFDYDSYSDSKLFISYNACLNDAAQIRNSESEEHYKRGMAAKKRRELQAQGKIVLEAAGINTKDVYWVVSEEPPVLQEALKRYIYFLEVHER